MEQYAESISIQLKLISDRIRQSADSAFAGYGLTGVQVGYIHFLEESGGSSTQKDLERAAGVSHPTVVGIIGRLQEKGFVEVTTDEKDRRNRIVTLTQKAKEVNSELRSQSKALNRQLIRGLTRQQKEELTNLLSKISENLDEGPGTEETVPKKEERREGARETDSAEKKEGHRCANPVL